MNILTIDFETFFSDDYTLKKMTTEAYIRDPRFEVLLLGYRFTDGRNGYVTADPMPGCDSRYTEIHHFFETIDWQNTAVLCHHGHFDISILNWHYGIRPAFIFDTLSMGRLVHGNSISVALGSLAAHYGLEPKSVPYDLFKGKRWHELSPEVRKLLGDGCCHDVMLTWQLFTAMLGNE